jgi:hypothetical protein
VTQLMYNNNGLFGASSNHVLGGHKLQSFRYMLTRHLWWSMDTLHRTYNNPRLQNAKAEINPRDEKYDPNRTVASARYA